MIRTRRFTPLSSGFGLVYQALAEGGERGRRAIIAWGLSQRDESEAFAAACGDPDARPELAMQYFGFLDPIEAARRALDG